MPSTTLTGELALPRYNKYLDNDCFGDDGCALSVLSSTRSTRADPPDSGRRRDLLLLRRRGGPQARAPQGHPPQDGEQQERQPGEVRLHRSTRAGPGRATS